MSGLSWRRRWSAAGMGLVLLTAAGCGNDAVEDGPVVYEGTSEDVQQGEQIPLPELTGQQVCALLGPATLATYVPGGDSSNTTVESTDQVSKARCESQVPGARTRHLAIEVHAGLPTVPGEEPVDRVTTVRAAEFWLGEKRETAVVAHQNGVVNGITHDEPADLAVGAEGFTQVSVDTGGLTDGRGYFRSGIWGVEINYAGHDKPDPDDRENKQYLAKDVLEAAIAAIGAEVDGNLAALAGGSGEPTGTPDEPSGDALCAALSDELIEQYLPSVRDRADTTPAKDGRAGADCEWLSAVPRTDGSGGLRHRDGSASVTVWEAGAEEEFAESKVGAQQDHDTGPVADGPAKGRTYTAPQDVPGLGQAAWLRLSHAGPEGKGTSATLFVLLPGNRTVKITYGGYDGVEVDDDSTDGIVQLADDEAIGGVTAMAEEIVPALG